MRIFSFPNPVNDLAARTVASGVVVMAAIAIAFRLPWMTIPLAYGFVARVLTGPTLSPLGQLATRVIAPRLGAPRPIPGPPKRFAQGMGATFSLAALTCWLAGETTAALVLLAVLLVPATLEAAFGYCVGCRLFGLMMRAGLIPESICLECADLVGHRAAAARAEPAETRSAT